MTTFKNIPITVESPSAPSEADVVASVLRDIQALLNELITSGNSGAIDLRQVPHLGTDAYELLKQTLSTGEVTATVNSHGGTEINETSFPCVWWATYRGGKNAVVTEVIEVTECPEILKSQRADARHGLRRLANQIAAGITATQPVEDRPAVQQTVVGKV